MRLSLARALGFGRVGALQVTTISYGKAGAESPEALFRRSPRA